MKRPFQVSSIPYRVITVKYIRNEKTEMKSPDIIIKMDWACQNRQSKSNKKKLVSLSGPILTVVFSLSGENVIILSFELYSVSC